MRNRMTITAVLAAAAMAVTGVAAAQPASHRLTPSGTGTQSYYFVPLAGSSSTLVLTKQPRLPRDVNLSATADPRFSSAPDEIYLRSTGGGLTKLGLRPVAAQVFSLVGTTLAAGRTVDDDSPRTNEAYVWQTTTKQRTEIALGSSDVYLAAAPGGVLYAAANGELRIRTVGGQNTTLAMPFGANAKIVAAAVDAAGAVVSDDAGGIAHVSFAAPHAVTPLQNPSSGTPLVCYQVTGGYAACAEAAYDSDFAAYLPHTPVLVPIDGGVPTVDATPGGCASFGRFAVAGASELWTCEDISATDYPYPYYLHSLAAGTSVSAVAVAAVGSALVSAYGKAVGVTTNGDSVYQASSALAGATLIPVTPAPVAVDSFALSPSGVIYSDNQRVSSRADKVESVFYRGLRAKGSSVRISPARLLGGAGSTIAGNLVGLSSSVKVFATKAAPGHSVGNAVLHIVGSHGTKTIDDVVGQGQIQVSGSRVLYQVWNDGHPRVVVYDAARRKTVATRKGNGLDYHGFALAGHHLAYATKQGAIYLEDLTTGKRTLLRKALPNDPGGVEFDVYAYGNWVGWHALPVQHELAKPLNQIRNAKTMAKTISLPHTLYSLTSAGAILSSTHATFRMAFQQAGEVPHPTRFWLRSYSGATRSLLPKASYLSGPQIAGKLLAWADANGVLRTRLNG